MDTLETDKTPIVTPKEEKVVPINDKVNLPEYIAVSHSLLGLCMAKDKTPVHERLAYFGFVTTASIGVAMFVAQYFPDGGLIAKLWAIGISVCIVTPASFVYKCAMGCLGSMKVLLEMTTVIFMMGAVYWADHEEHARDAAIVGCMALGAEWVAEVPSLIFKYFFCATVCPCCVPKKDSLNSARDIFYGAPSVHIDMER